MITCRKCREVNDAAADRCQKCGKNLLPGYSFYYRLQILIAGIIAFAICAWWFYRLMQNPDLMVYSDLFFCTNPFVWIVTLILIPLATLGQLIRKTPDHTRYELRADRHKQIDPEQAIADLSEAIKLAPKKKQGDLLKKRSEVHKAIGNEEESLRDRLGYLGSEVDDETGLHSLGKAVDISTADLTSSWREGERRGLVKLGKIKAVGFCKKCKHAVDLTWKIRCPEHRRKKPIADKYILPQDLETTLAEVEVAGTKVMRKNRVLTIIFMVLFVAGITICVIVPWLMGYFSG